MLNLQGTIERSATKETGVTYTLTGIIDQVDETTLKISELPVRKWTQDYKEYLETMMTVSEKNKEPFIKVRSFPPSRSNTAYRCPI